MNTSLPRMVLDAERLRNVDDALRLEWLVTNGLGGYASATVLGVNTRKYHGLLVAALNPPTNRHVLLSKLDEEIQIGKETYQLGINEFRDTFYPKPHGLLQEFALNPFPTFTYKTHDVTLQRTVFMSTGKNAVIVTYDINNAGNNQATIRIFPLLNFRHFYHTTHKAQLSWSYTQKSDQKTVTFQFSPSNHVLVLSSDQGSYTPNQGIWIENLFLRTDAARMEDCYDDCLQPGHFELIISPKHHEKFTITAVADESEEGAHAILKELNQNGTNSEELRRRSGLVTTFQKQYPNVKLEEWIKWAILATDAFVVNRASTKDKSVIAGYHWFEDWGRDTLISLPGLTLITGRYNDAKQILSTFKQYCKQGIVPNRFPDRQGDTPEYNTVDASLWYFNAILQYVRYTGDFDFVKNQLWNTLQSIIDHYEKGTLNNIHMDKDGLIIHGAQLTWMDATINNTPITPRAGKTVEIQALWYNALTIMQKMAKLFNEKNLEKKYAEMADQTKKSFNEAFWNPHKNSLFDVVTDRQGDASLRPNQIFAVSLPFSMLDPAKSGAVVSAVQDKLWCQYGLRTLSPNDAQYIGKSGGDLAHRNQAYHNGTVWPWLLGPFVTAFLKVKDHETKAREFALQKFLVPFFQKTISEAGLGTISETYDGDAPHVADGCIAQAWSVAEPLRALVEDALFRRPRFEEPKT